ncbi:hypothetical protein BB560_002919 [Smittium megazygosporum]|uniref:Multifunctional fusion protein n=1 Tax=Smittium megazygosporum TaxID=133381 RepID=A0A2T9ZDG9_9FUNG|nr:hypothetical protein BB560_002919 [Smittium megazygosporum]
MSFAFRSSGIRFSSRQASSLFPTFVAGKGISVPSAYRTSQFSIPALPKIINEPMRDYPPGSSDRLKMLEAIETIKSNGPYHVNLVINGKEVKGQSIENQLNPSNKDTICTYETASDSQAIEGALQAQKEWSSLPIYDRQAVFLKAADLITNKYRYLIMASTMLGQGKNIWQAEIDAAAEAADFLRFNVKYSSEIYKSQPPENSPGIWNHVQYRPLEGFVYAVSPFNFTAIGLNLSAAPALMGNTVVWKPSDSAVLSNYIMYKVLEEAGLPAGVIQFIPGNPVSVSKQVFSHPDFGALHFTGSTKVFKQLWKTIGNNIDIYKSYPRIVGETGGKNFHLLHTSADVDNVVNQTARGAFEYQGQKCSACSRVYVPHSLWPEFSEKLVNTISTIKIGDISDPENFMGPVINQNAFNKIQGYIDYANSSSDCKVLAGGSYDSSKGYFINPTFVQTTNLEDKLLKEEIFGPVLTAYVYPDADFAQMVDYINKSNVYGLTGSIFAQSREAIVYATENLKNAAGNFYINDKCTGAVVGQQPFGGSRASGTNDKAGSANILSRFVSPRSVKEAFLPISTIEYPSNLV